MTQVLEQLQQNPGFAATLPSDEGAIVRDALDGRSVYEIAQNHSTSEASVWRVLGNAARMASGNPPARQVETGGFGSDTDPGVTGGYGATGFGDLSADIDPGVIDSDDAAGFDEQQTDLDTQRLDPSSDDGATP
jgi:hypothetical protein